MAWIEDFVSTYEGLTGRWPLIYTTLDWWSTCTGNDASFSDRSPLWLARYASSVGTIPNGWGFATIWQYNAEYSQGGDSNQFNGDASRLTALATGDP